jgi:hypothetical protein
VINLIVPPPSSKYFMVIDQFLFGPFTPGKLTLEPETISFRSIVDAIDQGGSLFDENDVEHTKASGDIYVNPFALSIENSYSSDRPQRILYKYTDGELYCDYGYATLGATPSIVSGSDITHFAVIECTNSKFVTLRPVSWSYRNGVLSGVNLERLEYRLTTSSGSLQYYKMIDENREVSENLPTHINFLSTLDTLQRLWDSAPSGTVTSSIKYGRPYAAKLPASFSIKSMTDYINSMASRMSRANIPFPDDVPYGDLAMDATSKVNRNPVNMIAFIRDLRHPLEMIPRLKNLRLLKGAASEYLRLEYGILPTIDDIHSIYKAFSRIAPFLDTHGYNTYNAFRSQTAKVDDSTLTVEQRIKVAVENEDSDFKRLANAIDSYGFSLTLEDIWDLVPYSFAIDWFIDIGELLHRADTRLQMLNLKIKYSTLSRKRICDRIITYSPDLPMSGTLSLVHYSRWTLDHCPVPPLSFQNTITATDHWLEAGALLLQRGK